AAPHRARGGEDGGGDQPVPPGPAGPPVGRPARIVVDPVRADDDFGGRSDAPAAGRRGRDRQGASAPVPAHGGAPLAGGRWRRGGPGEAWGSVGRGEGGSVCGVCGSPEGGVGAPAVAARGPTLRPGEGP